MKTFQTLLLSVLLLLVFLQYMEQRRTTEAVRVLTEIIAEALDAQECDREPEVTFDNIGRTFDLL